MLRLAVSSFRSLPLRPVASCSQSLAVTSLICDARTTVPRRCYAKGKGIQKHSKKGAVLDRGEAIDPEILDVEAVNDCFNACLSRFKDELSSQLSLRSNVRAYEDLLVKLQDGEKDVTKALNHLARISLKNPQLIVINCSQNPAYVKAIKTAIEHSALNVTPQSDGSLLYVPIPPVTKERREELAKKAKQIFNNCNEALSKEYGRHLKIIQQSSDKIGKRIAEEHLLKMKNELRDTAHSIADAKAKELLQQKI